MMENVEEDKTSSTKGSRARSETSGRRVRRGASKESVEAERDVVGAESREAKAGEVELNGEWVPVRAPSENAAIHRPETPSLICPQPQPIRRRRVSGTPLTLTHSVVIRIMVDPWTLFHFVLPHSAVFPFLFIAADAPIFYIGLLLLMMDR